MNTESITQIRTNRDNLQESLRTFRVAEFTGNYGPEQEYTSQKIIEGIKLIVIGVTALTKSPAKFIHSSTLADRQNLAGYLSEFNTHIKNKDLNSLVDTLENTKSFFRIIGSSFTNERIEAYEESLNKLLEDFSSLSQHIIDAEAIKSETNEIKEKVDSSHHLLNKTFDRLDLAAESLKDSINSTAEERRKLTKLIEQDSARSQQIEQILTEAKSHKGVIDSYVEKISERETQLENQGTETKAYTDKLKTFEADYANLLSQINDLKKDSISALELSTSVGLSKAFSTQYKVANKFSPKLFWISTAVIFGGFAVYLGWEVIEINEETSLAVIMSRISLLPILIAGAWFCIGQYVKQKNIAEDYAYKAVLAKSIVGFSEQLATESNKGDDHSIFMRLALSEMIKNPLRKHKGETSAVSETLNKLAEIFKIKTPE